MTASSTVAARAADSPTRPEPITFGSSPGTSEISRASASRPPRWLSRRPPLSSERRLRIEFNASMSRPLASAQVFSCCKSCKLVPGGSTSTRLELPPEMRNRMRRSDGSDANRSSNRAPAASVFWSGTGWPATSCSTCAWESSSAGKWPALEMTNACAASDCQRVDRTECHRGCGFADGNDLPRIARWHVGQRFADSPTTVYSGKRLLPDTEQQRVPVIHGTARIRRRGESGRSNGAYSAQGATALSSAA